MHIRLSKGPVGIMHRTSPEHAMALPSRILQALLLLLFVASPLLHCNAALSGNNSSSISKQMGGVVRALSTQKQYASNGLYPGLILFDADVEYDLQLSDILTGSSWSYSVEFFKNGNAFFSKKTTFNEKLNMLYFKTQTSNQEGRINVILNLHNGATKGIVFTFHETPCIPFGKTQAIFPTVNRHYGLSLQASAKLPDGVIATDYLLVRSIADCQKLYLNCKTGDGCYKLQSNSLFPPPGSYYLCVTARGWGGRYLPWGANPLKVSALIAMPLTLFTGNVPSITVYDADTGVIASSLGEANVFLVGCTNNKCPSMRPEQGDSIVAVDACTSNSIRDRVVVSLTKLNANSGVYALCVMDSQGNVSPAALPVNVVDDPLSMKMIKSSDVSVELEVSGGNIGDRNEKYTICIAEDNKPCSTVTLGESKCTESADKNSKVVVLDVSKVTEKDQMTFCFVSGTVSHNNIRYLDITGELMYKQTTSPPKKIDIWVVVGIVVSCVFLVSVVLVIIVLCLVRRKNKEDASFVSDS